MAVSRPLILLAGLLPVLGACDTLSRFGGSSPQPSPVAIGQPLNPQPLPPADDDTLAAPLSGATSRTLPPPGGADDLGPDATDDQGPLVAPGARDPSDNLSPGSPLSTNPQVAGLPPVNPPLDADPAAPATPTVATPRPPQPAAPTSTSRVVGGWKLAEQNGTSCKLNLSSAPFVDLSRASTSGCSPALAKVNAWKLENGEIVLFETGGAVAARLRGGGAAFNGAAVKTGAPVTISR